MGSSLVEITDPIKCCDIDEIPEELNAVYDEDVALFDQGMSIATATSNKCLYKYITHSKHCCQLSVAGQQNRVHTKE